MNERTRHRVTGSVFLIALAFIGLPMVFDGSGLPAVDVRPIESPDVRLRPSPAVQEPNVEPAVVADAASLRETVDDDGYAADGTRVGEPVLRPERRGDAAARMQPDSAWAVQLASFSDRANAVALRDRLRADGYEAVLSNARQGSVASTRVAIGPILSRDDAVRLQHELSERYQLAPIVVAFSP